MAVVNLTVVNITLSSGGCSGFVLGRSVVFFLLGTLSWNKKRVALSLVSMGFSSPTLCCSFRIHVCKASGMPIPWSWLHLEVQHCYPNICMGWEAPEGSHHDFAHGRWHWSPIRDSWRITFLNKCQLQFSLFHAQPGYCMSYSGLVAQQWWLALRLWDGFSRDPHLHFSVFALSYTDGGTDWFHSSCMVYPRSW